MRLLLPRLALVVSAALALSSCDAFTPEPPSDEFALSPLPEGTSLFASAPAGSARTAAARSDSNGGPLRFGCYLSTPNLGAPIQDRYRLSAILAEFPQAVLDEAAGQSRVVTVRLGSRALYADTERDAPTLLRTARCVVPDADDAVDLVVESLARFERAPAARWDGEPMARWTQETAAGGAHSAASRARSPAPSSARTASVTSGGCHDVWVEVTPEGWAGSDDTGWTYHPPVWEVQTICESNDQGGGSDDGGGGGPTSPGGDPCGSGGGPGYMPANDFDGLGCNQEVDDPVKSYEIHKWYRDRCGVDISRDPAEANNLWSDNVAEAFGVKVESKDSKSPGYRPLDGYKVRNGYITSIYEVKNTVGWTFSGDDIEQAIGHIDRLVAHREALRKNADGVSLSVTAPTYVVVTTSPHENLDYHNRVFNHARDNGVNLRVYRPQSQYFIDWHFTGERLNTVFGGYDDWYAGIPHDAVPNWLDWIDPTRELPDEGLRMTCTPDVIREGAPKSPPGS